MRIFIAFLVSIFVTGISSAQWQNRFVFSRLGKETGLLSDVITSVTQDDAGYLWFATSNGLQRYDGTRFLTMHHSEADSSSIPDGTVIRLLFDKKHRLWLMLSGNKVGYMNPHTFRFTQVKVSLPPDVRNNDLLRLKEEPDGRLQIFVSGYGVITYDENAREFSSSFNIVQSGNLKVPQDICYAGKGMYWVSSDQGYDLYDLKKKQFIPRNSNTMLSALNKMMKDDKSYVSNRTLCDSAGNFWNLTWSGTKGVPEINHFDAKRNTWTSYANNLVTTTKNYFDIADISIQRDGTVWVYGGNIFARLNEKTNGFEDVRNESLLNHGIMVEIIYQVFEDRDGNLWVCSTSGLYFFNPGKQFFVNLSNKRKDGIAYTNAVNSIVQVKNGNIYSSAWGAGVFAYDSGFNIIPNPVIPRDKDNMAVSVWDMVENRKGELWMGMQGGEIAILDQQSGKRVHYHLSVFEDHTVRQVAEDSLGNMWMGTQSGLLVKCINGNWRDTVHSFQLLYRLKGHVIKMMVDSYGYVWVCTDRFGVFKLNPVDGKIVDRYTNHSPDDRRLTVSGASDILQYNDSMVLLIAGSVDQINLKTGKITHGDFRKSNTGLPVCFVKDHQGYVWVGTNDGLFRFMPGKKIFTYYDGDDGITDTRFEPNASAVLRNGSLIFGTVTGLLLIDPYRLSLPGVSNSVTISEFRVFDKNLLVDSLLGLKKITLPYTDNSISIALTTFNYNREFGIKYLLEGLDKTWQVSTNNELQYSYLAPGTYTLKMKTVSAAGTESEEKSIVIEINPPFWNSWGFYGLLVLSIIGILYLIDKERMNRIKSTQEIRQEIGMNLAGEVNTALSNINILSEMAKRKADNDVVRSKELIEQISEKSTGMITTLDDMLWSIDPSNDRMDNLLRRMNEHIETMQKNHNAEITMLAEPRLSNIELNMKLRYSLYSIFKEGLRSIIQLSGGRKTTINLDLYKHRLLLKMQDNTARYVDDTNCMRATDEMQKHAANIDGEIDLQQDKNGIYIFLMFPVK